MSDVRAAFDGRVLGIDNAVSDNWGRMSAIGPVPVVDGLLAATALSNGLTLVTRNDRDVAGLGVTVLKSVQARGKSPSITAPDNTASDSAESIDYPLQGVAPVVHRI
jgi:hypothetical protein